MIDDPRTRSHTHWQATNENCVNLPSHTPPLSHPSPLTSLPFHTPPLLPHLQGRPQPSILILLQKQVLEWVLFSLIPRLLECSLGMRLDIHWMTYFPHCRLFPLSSTLFQHCFCCLRYSLNSPCWQDRLKSTHQCCYDNTLLLLPLCLLQTRFIWLHNNAMGFVYFKYGIATLY